MAQEPNRYDNVKEALCAAQGRYPLSYLIAIRGNARAPSEYAPSEASLTRALEQSEFGSHAGDVVTLWLPTP